MDYRLKLFGIFSEPQVAVGTGIATKLERFEAELLASRPGDSP